MEIMKAIEARRSIRKYRPDPVDPEKLAKIAEAFRLAPSAVNAQNWKLLIISDPAVKKESVKHYRVGLPLSPKPRLCWWVCVPLKTQCLTATG